MTSEYFRNLGYKFLNCKKGSSENVSSRRFKSFFGISPTVCSIVWNIVKGEVPQESEPKHILWCLCFLKQYPVEHLRRSLFNADEKTIRKWTWFYIELLSNLSVVQWENRFQNAVAGQTCFCSLDGVDFKISEPKPFNKRWFSHKFRGPGLRYEIGLCVRSGTIVWKHGGYPCGEYPDLKLAREAFVLSTQPGELTLADKGYSDRNFFLLPTVQNGVFHKRIMARHETVNKRIRQFRILKDTFRNSLDKHPMVFHAVVNLTQLMIENGEPLYSVIN